MRTNTRAVERTNTRSIQLFEPPSDAVYTIETAAHLLDLPRRRILVYCKHRLLASVNDPADGYYFDRGAIKTLRRIESLRAIWGDNFRGIKIILDLMRELERLHSEVRSLRASNGRSPIQKKKQLNKGVKT